MNKMITVMNKNDFSDKGSDKIIKNVPLSQNKSLQSLYNHRNHYKGVKT